MRRSIATVVLVSVVALGAAACGSSDGDTAAGGASPSAAATTAGASAATQAACQEAIAASESGAKAFGSGMEEMQKLILEYTKNPDDKAMEAKGTELETKMRGDLKAWGEKLTALAGQDVDATVKTALTDAAKTVTDMNADDNEATGPEAQAALDGVVTKIKTACA
ncbi:hypothetical protein O7635_28860 [Asanoa sp. WMMD1127]|uniref:hypothetical protein n=1 Tax=Asanoa sp. WMMD1127 TaxID=3016107 RepID=UPI0024170F2D|nr:hypothetical protein [Asanoa sp. WMMD1127]MDG4825877.1 hypothetical protein [Asanoa sp. WMMD1127]